MTQEIIALVFIAVICIVLPLVVLGILIGKNQTQWKGIIALFLCGAIIYCTMQWGLKEHGLAWLFNNTGFDNFMSNHYIPYLLVVALVGTLLTVLPQMFVIAVLFKRNISFGKAIAFALGYGMTESVLLIGLRCINTIIEIKKGTELELGTTAVELFLSGYERILIMIIEVAIVVTLVYFMEQRMSVRGGLIAVFWQAVVAFFPGFLIAFSLSDYLEVYDRTIALTLVYFVLTVTTIAAVIILNALKYQLKD